MSDLLYDFEDDIEFDRHPERKTGDADYHPNRCLLDAEDISKQVRDSVRDPGLVEEVPEGRYEYSEADDASHSIEGAQMLFRRSENSQGRSVSGISSGFCIELFPKSANILRLVVHNWKHIGRLGKELDTEA